MHTLPSLPAAVSRYRSVIDDLIGAAQVRDAPIFIYLAQVYFGLKDYRNTVQAISNAGDLVNKDATLISLKAESYWHLNQTEAAINALNDGQRAFPSDFRFS